MAISLFISDWQPLYTCQLAISPYISNWRSSLHLPAGNLTIHLKLTTIYISASWQSHHTSQTDDNLYICQLDHRNCFWQLAISSSLHTNIGKNDICEECTLFGYPVEEDIIQILNYCVLLAQYFKYNDKLNGKNTLDLYSYLVLLKRIYSEKSICTQQNKPQLFEKWLFLYEGL